MKNLYAAIIIALCGSNLFSQTTILANFDFNGSASYPVSALTTASGITASINGNQANAAYSGAATGSAAFVQNTTAGTALSMSNSSGTNSAYWTLTLGGGSLATYQAYKIYLQSEHSSTGAAAINISYSINGTAYTALSQTVSPGLNTTFTEAVVDLSSITAINGASSLYIRFSASGASGTGTLRIDNLQVQGSSNTSGSAPWTVSGSNVGFTGNVGIGTSSPQYPLDVVGDMHLTGGIIFDANNGIKYTAATAAAAARYVFGKPLPLIPPCITPGGSNFQFSGSIQSRAMNGSVNSALTMFSAPWDGTGVIETEGTDDHGGGNNSLLLNYYCGRDVNICTNSGINGGSNFHGGIVIMGKNVEIGAPYPRNTSVTMNIKTPFGRINPSR